MSQSYTVEWTINVEADSPREAALQAFAHMQRTGTTANVFQVYDDLGSGEPVTIDLEDDA